MIDVFNLNDVVGVLFIGIEISILSVILCLVSAHCLLFVRLYGITCAQIVYYYYHYPNDRYFEKICVSRLVPSHL